MAPRAITEEEKQTIQQLVARARVALKQIADYDQARVDQLIQAVGWALSNEKTFTRLSNMGVDESGLGDRAGRPSKRFKLHGILRDALRAKSMGIVEEDHVKGITKYAKPVGIIASLVPVTNAGHTEVGNGIYSLKCKNVIIFAPHPAGKKTSIECVRLMREAVKKLGCPEDVFQIIEKPSIPLAQELMAQCDLTIATGGQQMVRAAYSSGKPAYGVGAGNATMVIDETADIDIAARNTRISKTSDNGSGCSADGNLIVDARIYDKFLEALQKEGGYLVTPDEKVLLQKAMWDEEGHRTSPTIARPAKVIAELAGFKIGDDKKFLIVPETHIGKEYLFSSEKLSPVLSIIKYDGGFDEALKKVEQIYEVGGRGHSCGIYSHNDEHIHRLALMAPVSRMMVRQPQSKANAGSWDNGMPMTSSMGCGIWGGNITNENVNVKHYMQLTWVSRPISEDRPSEQALFGEFYNTEVPDMADGLKRYDHYIGGKFVPPADGVYFPTENPYSGKAWAEIARGREADVNAAVAAARKAFTTGEWPSLTATERGKYLHRMGELISANAEHLAETERRDNGKLKAEVLKQIRYMAEYFFYYAGMADKIEGKVIPTDKEGVFAYTKNEPKGVVAIITPWNSPLTLTSWKLAPALATGCTTVIKPSEFTSASMIEMAMLFQQAGFPDGVVNVVTGFGGEVGVPLVSHPDIAHVGFTGGEAAGIAIYQLAAKGLKTVTLELGGKSPNIVFDDADFDQAVKGVVSGIFAAAGQTCVAGSRLLVQENIHDEFVGRLIEFVKHAKLGDPGLEDTQIGPIATRPQFEKILSYIEVAKAEGAKCVLGGKARTDLGAGQFIEPTIFINVDNKMRIAQEEVFGPVLSVIKFKDVDDAIRIGNDVVYGLAAGLWTKSLDRAMRVSDKLQAGSIWVNNYRSTSFTSPFGGFKRSGVGRESGSNAMLEFLEVKTVWISTDLDVPNPFIRR